MTLRSWGSHTQTLFRVIAVPESQNSWFCVSLCLNEGSRFCC